jgi:hypothetical protein
VISVEEVVFQFHGDQKAEGYRKVVKSRRSLKGIMYFAYGHWR